MNTDPEAKKKMLVFEGIEKVLDLLISDITFVMRSKGIFYIEENVLYEKVAIGNDDDAGDINSQEEQYYDGAIASSDYMSGRNNVLTNSAAGNFELSKFI